MVGIDDPQIVALSGAAVHPILVHTGNKQDTVEGVVMDISDDDLKRADDYEVSSYQRVEAPLASGGNAWVYVENKE